MKAIERRAAPTGRDVVVIGGSAGAVPLLQHIAEGLPADLPAAVFIVLHAAPGSRLPKLLERAGPLPAAYASDGEDIKRGQIYVAPPGRQLEFSDVGKLRVRRGPLVHRYRPAIDVSFWSAASVFGTRVIGVVLSGAGHDGTLGLGNIKLAGGVTVVQDPSAARFPAMPSSALRHADHVLAPDEIHGMVGRLAEEAVQQAAEVKPLEGEQKKDQAQVARGDDQPGTLTGFICPQCGGNLWETGELAEPTLRCRVGHAFSAASFAQLHAEDLEATLWAAVQALDQQALVGRRLEASAASKGAERSASHFSSWSQHAKRHADVLRQVLGNQSPPPLEAEDEEDVA